MTQTPASGPFGPLTTPPISVAPTFCAAAVPQKRSPTKNSDRHFATRMRVLLPRRPGQSTPETRKNGVVLRFGAFLASRSGMRLRLSTAVLPACAGLVPAQPKGDDPPAVVVTALQTPVPKSYRRIAAGMERLERRHDPPPAASLRFRLLPRHRDTNM